METLTETATATVTRKKPETSAFVKPAQKSRLIPGFSQQAILFEQARFGWMAIMLTFQSCLGSIACMFILYNGANIFMLATCAAITMGSNAMFIALARPKVCLGAFYISVVLNTIFILVNQIPL